MEKDAWSTDDSELEELYSERSADDPDSGSPILSGSACEGPRSKGRYCRCGCRPIECMVAIMISSLVVVSVTLVSLFLLGLLPWRPKTQDVWTLRSLDGAINLSGASVPGSVHMALYRAGIIGDPYFRFNDVNLTWVQRQPWIFEHTFHVNENLDRQTVKLVCEGIDTVASIKFNNIEIANVSNQFLRHVLDVTDIIQEGENNISIEIASAVTYGKRKSEELEEELGYKVPPACRPPEEHPECHANMVRKEQAAFGWDWGPAFVTQGIWKDITLVNYIDCRILDLVAQSLPADGMEGVDKLWDLNVTVYVECGKISPRNARLRLKLSEINDRWDKDIHVTQGENLITHIIRDLNVEMWWPNGHGNQKLYTLEVTLEIGSTQSKKTVRTGFRTVKLVQKKLPNGLGFHFNVNGRPIFMKGSNWIPADSFQERVDKARIQNLLQSAVSVNMNCIRVWGGGVYESDYFYDLADEYGLLIWQDFMFACSMYPATKEFLSSVRQEVKFQLRRLVSHPCIMALSGNNENEGAIVDNWYGTNGSHFQDYLHDYKKLYKGVIEEEVKSVTQIPFLISSPSNGNITESQGGVSLHPEPSSSQYGDVHYYNYLDDCLNMSIYPRTRFASEYGWQSWPSYSSLKKVSLPGDLAYESEFFVHREHHIGAGEGTDQLIHRHFIWPNNTDTEEGFKNYIYLTQVVQAICYRAETEFYRRGRGDADLQTMGALYWQLNDIWQAPSWATLEYDGSWKMAHHFGAKYFFSDIVMSTYIENGTIHGYVINDGTKDLDGFRVDLNVFNWEYLDWVAGMCNPCNTMRAGTVTKVFEYQLSELCELSGLCDAASGFTTFQLRHADPEWDGSIPVRVQFLGPYKDIKGLKDPKIRVLKVEKKDSHTFTIYLECEYIAFFTWLDAGDIKGRFSDNGFAIYKPDRDIHTHDIDFYAWQDGVSTKLLEKSISITSLWDTMS